MAMVDTLKARFAGDHGGVENTPEPQPCEVCGTLTDNIWWDRDDEPHAACFNRCERVMAERELGAMLDTEEDRLRDERTMEAEDDDINW